MYEAQFSSVVTGLHDKYWIAVSLKDEFFNGSSRSESEEQQEDVDGSIDPIVDTDRERSSTDPRCYWLQIMANNVKVAVNEEEYAKEVLNSDIDQYVSPMITSTNST